MVEVHELLNSLSEEDAARALHRCCGSQRWVAKMTAARPFSSTAELFAVADELWGGLVEADYLEAFSHHPQIGADRAELARRFAATAALSSSEQASVASASATVLDALRDGNLAYEARFGFVFLVCATGKSAEEMLQILQNRLPHEREQELAIAAAEQAKITRLRLQGLGS